MTIHRPGSVHRGLIERRVRHGGELRPAAKVLRQVSRSQLRHNAVFRRAGVWGQCVFLVAEICLRGKHLRPHPIIPILARRRFAGKVLEAVDREDGKLVSAARELDLGEAASPVSVALTPDGCWLEGD